LRLGSTKVPQPFAQQNPLPKTVIFHRIPPTDVPRFTVHVVCQQMCTAPSIRRKDAPARALPSLSVRLTLAIFLSSISLLGATQLRAQSDDSQQNTKDVAEAARQERARRQQRNAPNHIYTNEDLHRAKILTPEDQSRAAAKHKATPHPATKENAEPLNANSAPA